MGQILILDDDDATRTALRSALTRAGHVVREASNGVEGAKLYREVEPDLIVTDINMPGQDGVETLLEVRRAYPAVKIIVISGNAQEFLPILEDLGAHRTFAKPFQSGQLLAAVRDLLAAAP